MGAELLEYLVTGKPPSFNEERLHGSTVLLYQDLLRQGLTGVEFELGEQLDSESVGLVAPILATTNAGNRFIIALSGPLTSGHPVDPAIAEYRNNGGTIPVIVENELVVRGNLPSVTNVVRHAIEG